MSEKRLIDANALLKEFEKRQEQQVNEYCDCFLNDAQEISTEWWCVEDLVASAPTIDAVPVVHARWEYLQYHTGPKIGNWHCTKCRRIMPSHMVAFAKYCLYCGAKMDAADKNVGHKD